MVAARAPRPCGICRRGGGVRIIARVLALVLAAVVVVVALHVIVVEGHGSVSARRVNLEHVLVEHLLGDGHVVLLATILWDR